MSGTSFITLNQSNVSPTQNNIFNYQFPSGSVNFKNARVAVQSIIIPYSWLNVDGTIYNNAAFQIKIPATIVGIDTVTTLNINMPKGFYTLSAINDYIQAQLIASGYYLIDVSGSAIFYIELVVNTQLNNAQLNCYPVPTSLPVGWSYGTTTKWGPNLAGNALPGTANQVPQLVTLANNFGSLIGFASSTTFPASNSSSVVVSTTSSFVPQITPVQSLYVGCSLVRNQYANPTNIITNVGLTSQYATNIIYIPQELNWMPILTGNFPSFSVIFYDQAFNQLPIVDTNLTINLMIQFERSANNDGAKF